MISVPDISQTYPKESLTLDSRFVVGEGNARDLSGDSNTGTLVSGRALSLDGTADYLTCGTGIDVTSGGSISIWAKAGSVSGSDQIILETTDSGNRFAVQMTGATFQVSWYPNATYRGVASSSVSADTWYHIVGTVDDSDNTALYINGVAQSGSYSTIGTSGTNVTAIGTRLSSADRLFTGSLSCAKVFNVELTAAQALELYNNPEQVLPTGVAAANLKRYYPLSDYVDDSANSLNGLYVMDCGADKINGLAVNTGMDLAEQSPCPQLGLMPSTSRVFFDGADDVYSVAADSDINGLFASGGSISAWIFPNSEGDSYGMLANTFDNGGYVLNLHTVSSATSKLQFTQVFDGDDATWITNSHDITFGAWNHVVITYDGSNASNDPIFYVNASAKAATESIAAVGTVGADTGIKYFGANGDGAREFDGYISEVAMFKAILDADAVTAIHNSGVQGFDLSADAGNYDNSGDLKGWWKFNNAYTVQDLTSYNNDATAAGSPVLSVIPEGTTAGTTLFGNTEEKRADNAVINLNGKEYVTIPHDVNLNPDLSEGFTCSAWFKMRSLGSGSSTPIFDKDGGNDRWYLRIRDDASDVYQFNFGDGSGTTDIAGGTLSDTNWHHVAVTLDYGEDEGIFYVDGSAVGSATDISARGADCPGTDALTIGADGTTAVLDGAVAYPKIYARVLAANEIKLLYSSGHRVVGGL